MKTNFFTIMLVILSFTGLYSQNSTLTLGQNGVYYIDDSLHTNLFNVNSVNGQVHILNSLRLETTINNSIGVIFKGTDRFIHDYTAPNKDGFNTFIGINSGNFTIGGGSFGSINASGNTAVGYSTLSLLTSGFENSAFGKFALKNNTTGYRNAAFGVLALEKNTTTNDNSAFGNSALRDNAGEQNSAFGAGALLFNTTGNYNSAFGYSTLVSNTVGQSNSAFGWYALLNNASNRNSAFGTMTLQENTSGSLNAAFGSNALDHNVDGSQNSAFGTDAGTGITTGHNNTVIGYNAQVPSATSNNQVRIGNADITYAGIQVAWTITSDKKWKENIIESNLGLDFISKLNPVSYTRKNDETGKNEYGFIAQEIEETLNSLEISDAGIINVTDAGDYEMRYNDLFAPIVKAIQDLKKENDELKETNQNFQVVNDKLQSDTKELKAELSSVKELQNLLLTEIEKMKLNNMEVAQVVLEKK